MTVILTKCLNLDIFYHNKSHNTMISTVTNRIKSAYSDPLIQNSFYLMLSTGVTAGLGFIFWMICARLFTPSQIGLATSLISAMSLLSYASLLGFNVTFVRTLPTSSNRSNLMNTGLLLSISAAIVLSTIYVEALDIIAPKLDILLDTGWNSVIFVIIVALATINLLTDSIFIAFRSAKYNLFIDGFLMGTLKLILPALFISFGAYGIFMASGLAASVAMVASITFLVLNFKYKPKLKINIQTLRDMFHYSFVNYIASIFNIAPTLILPIIVLNRLGAESAGYYYLAFTVANLLYAVVYSVSSSMFAEGSYGEVELKKLFIRSATISAFITIPASLIMIFLGPSMLKLFGKAYGDSASQAITILALASPAVAAYTLGNVMLRITHQIYSIIIVNLVYVISIGLLAYLWVGYGLSWVAASWAIGNTLASLVAFTCLYRYKN